MTCERVVNVLYWLSTVGTDAFSSTRAILMFPIMIVVSLTIISHSFGWLFNLWIFWACELRLLSLLINHFDIGALDGFNTRHGQCEMLIIIYWLQFLSYSGSVFYSYIVECTCRCIISGLQIALQWENLKRCGSKSPANWEDKSPLRLFLWCLEGTD